MISDRYGIIGELQKGDVRFIPGKTRDQVRRIVADYSRRHKEVRRKVFEWSDDTGGILVRRLI
jgi:hypothetical protein